MFRSIAVACALLAAVVAACRPADAPAPSAPPPAPPPQVSGTIAVAGLAAPVRVTRDRWGIPHIAAASQDDLFFAQGFVQAQDRLFQMDLWRRSSLGRLAEVLGANFIERDAMTRRMQYRGDLDDEWESYGPDARQIAVAFTRGVNAWIDLVASAPPEEFRLAGWQPERWRAEDLLARTDAFVASGNAHDEVLHAQLAASVGVPTANALLPVPVAMRLRDDLVEPAVISSVVGDLLRRAGAPPFFSGLMAPFSPDGSLAGNGSNAWAVSGRRSATGAPLLAADPHRPLTAPAPRYLVHLQAPGWNVIGAASPWLPGVVIGHNERVAWSMAAAAADTQDLFVERLNPDNERQVQGDDGWVDMAVERDSVSVKGRSEPFEYERQYTPHGIVVGLDRQRHLAFVLRWSGTAPGGAAELASLSLNRARSAAELREGLQRWKMPAAEFVYADATGTIGRQTAALVPRRALSGRMPAGAWHKEATWGGWLPLDDLPHALDPPDGFVVAANGRTARINRLNQVLRERTRSTVVDTATLQQDVQAWNAERLLPLLARVRGTTAEVERLRESLLRWDRRVAAGSAEAPIYVAWEGALLQHLIEGRVPAALRREFAARADHVLVAALTSPSRAWFDAPVAGNRDALLVTALESVARNPAAPQFDPILFRHPLAVTALARQGLNVGPFHIGSYQDTVFSVSRSGQNRATGPAFRAIFDVADWDRSMAVNAPGQSESRRSEHYQDLAAAWAKGEYVPLAFSEESVATNAAATLNLTPR